MIFVKHTLYAQQISFVMVINFEYNLHFWLFLKGNNYFGEELQEQLLKVKDSEERTAYILMERVFPLPQRNVLVLTQKSVRFDDVVSELGIYGVIIG